MTMIVSVKNSNNKDNELMLWNTSLYFEIRQTRSYALYKRSCYTIVKREQSPNSILTRQNKKLQVSFALWLDFMWHIFD